MNSVVQAAGKFSGHDEIAGVEEYGRGLIHDTYVVTPGNGGEKFILQRLNTAVFKNPAALMHNLRLVCEHARQRMMAAGGAVAADWQMLRVIRAGAAGYFFIDGTGACWRAFRFIRNATVREQAADSHDAGEAGRALGTFHWLLSDLDPEFLHVTLPGFHDVEQYLHQYDAILAGGTMGRPTDSFCHRFIEARRSWAPVLERARREDILARRVIHGDPKVNNILFDKATGRATSLIDLDTVMPGLVHYDIGDCLRSCCNVAGENGTAVSAVRFDLNRCEALLRGYCGAARGFLTEADWQFLFDGVRLMPFELGLRFYSDYLAGNVYFKVSRPHQNLDRARVQFRLVQSIEQQEGELRGIIAACRAGTPSGAPDMPAKGDAG